MTTKKQGLFQRLFGQPQPEVTPTDAPATDNTHDYSVLPELAQILTNGNERAVSEMKLLAESVGGFAAARRDWCDEMDYGDFGADDAERQEETLLIFAYWLTGYQATDDPAKDPPQFGAYIDWKEEISDIIGLLTAADKNLGYGLELDRIKFGAESTGKALSMIDGFLSAKGLALCTLDTQSDCCHLFVLRGEDHSRLEQLAERVGFSFYREFE
jgi:hypothetical protein